MSTMPVSNGWYFQWVDFHRKATAANTDAVAALIVNEDIAIGIWEATSEELHECTKRLVSTRRTPKFANEHADAVGTELVSLRGERTRAGFMVHRPEPHSANACPMRCERGVLFAPMPHVIREGKAGRALLKTCAVLCDQCQFGLAEIAAQDQLEKLASPVKEEAWKKKKLCTLSRYFERTNGVDGIAILRQYEAERTAKMKATSTETHESLPTIRAMLARSMRVPYKERPRGPESIQEGEDE